MALKDTLVTSLGAAAGQVMKGLDGLFTSDDERNSARVLIEQEFTKLSTTILTAVNNAEQQRTDRHANDMKSDSWLSKNVRPLTLIFLLVLFTGLAITDSVESIQFNVPKSYVDLLESLLTAAFSFYFLSRGAEKIAKIVGDFRKTKIEVE